MMLTISSLGRWAWNKGVPLRSENSDLQLRQRTKRMSRFFPVQRTKRRFPAARLPASEHLELTQHRSDTSIGMALSPVIPMSRKQMRPTSYIGMPDCELERIPATRQEYRWERKPEGDWRRNSRMAL